MSARAGPAALALAALLAACAASKERSHEDAIVAKARAASPPHRGESLADDDPDARIAREEEARLQQLASNDVIRTVLPARRVSGSALVRLLPDHRFLLTAWQDRPADPQRRLSIPWGLYQITAIAPDGSRTRHFAYGNHEPFGKLLAQAEVRIATEDQAQLVWDAYCDLFKPTPRKRPCEKASATSWRLGVGDVGDRRYWYEVMLDETGRITAACRRSAMLGERH